MSLQQILILLSTLMKESVNLALYPFIVKTDIRCSRSVVNDSFYMLSWIVITSSILLIMFSSGVDNTQLSLISPVLFLIN